MAFGSGIATQIGYGEEVTYGTRVAPTRFLELMEESLQFEPGRRESEAIRANTRVQRSDRWSPARKAVSGSVSHAIADQGFALILAHCLGGTPSQSQPDAINAPSVFEYAINLDAPLGKSLTVQIGRASVDGTVHPFDYLGCKVAEWTISQDEEDAAMLELGLDGQDEDVAQSLEAVVYPSDFREFDQFQLAVTVDGSAYDVKTMSLEGASSLNTERYMAGSRIKREPLANAHAEITGEMEGEFESMAAYTRVRDGSVVPVVFTWTGRVLEDVQTAALEITLPAVRFDTGTPHADGPEVIAQPLTFKALDDGTADAPIKVVYRTTDATA